MNEIKLRRFDDMHCHFRSGAMMELVLPFTARYCGRAVAMPNLRPSAILSASEVAWYRREIDKVIMHSWPDPPMFEPIMTIEIRDDTTPYMVKHAFHVGALAGKVYPLGVTTNSEEGLRDFFSDRIRRTFQAMSDIGMILLIHGELDIPRTLVTQRETSFLPTLLRLVDEFPHLRIVLEHISTKESVRIVEQLGDNVAATITAHHPVTTLNDVVGDGVHPHNMCMPISKGFDDRDALLAAATSGNPKFFLGSDSAPHTKETKECAHGRCGVFTAPILPQLLVEVFENAGALDRLGDFTSTFGAAFYQLPLNKGVITLARQEWTVPEIYGNVVPFMAGKKLQWQLV